MDGCDVVGKARAEGRRARGAREDERASRREGRRRKAVLILVVNVVNYIFLYVCMTYM